MNQLNSKQSLLLAAICLILALVSLGGQVAHAGQGCPFDDGSCQDYCNQQGCNLGYCGHFAWIQCICRKCGDEWSWYDKVRYNPDKTVNQTELDSLKLNVTAPIILTNGGAQEQQVASGSKSGLSTTTTTTTSTTQQPKAQPAATLTTLLIPDLSDGTKVDLNDIPDEENSDKFLDYLAKNHEKLVRAQHKLGEQTSGPQQEEPSEEAKEEEEGEQQTEEASTQAPARPSPAEGAQEEPETVEIQISSSNNDSKVEPTTSGAGRPTSTGAPSGGQVARLLRMAVADEQQLGTDLGLSDS